jgi:hypothetical protein
MITSGKQKINPTNKEKAPLPQKLLQIFQKYNRACILR